MAASDFLIYICILNKSKQHPAPCSCLLSSLVWLLLSYAPLNRNPVLFPASLLPVVSSKARSRPWLLRFVVLLLSPFLPFLPVICQSSALDRSFFLFLFHFLITHLSRSIAPSALYDNLTSVSSTAFSVYSSHARLATAPSCSCPVHARSSPFPTSREKAARSHPK